MKTIHALLLTSTLALAACGGAGMRSYEPVAEKTKFDQEQLFGASQRSIEKLGYFPTNLDHNAYTVSTREKEAFYSSVPRLSYKYSFTIETKGGLLHIIANCTMNSSMNREKFDECGEDRPKPVVEEMDQLKTKILEIAKSLPAAPKFDEPMPEDEPAPEAEEKKAAGDAPADKKAEKKEAAAPGSTAAKDKK